MTDITPTTVPGTHEEAPARARAAVEVLLAAEALHVRERMLFTTVHAARDAGLQWRELGRLLGSTGDSARYRFGGGLEGRRRRQAAARERARRRNSP